MKTIKSKNVDGRDDAYRRVNDDTAAFLVGTGSWHYCPKKEWKENVRDKK